MSPCPEPPVPYSDVTTAAETLPGSPPETLTRQLRILRVIAAAEFRLKYADSSLGYAWSILKPLALFTMLYLVFGRLFGLNEVSPYYAVSLLIGIVLFGFFADATSLGMTSLVARESLLRKLVFPRIVIPVAATLTAAMTFGVNAVVVIGFIAWRQITPQLEWLLIPLLLLELYAFTLGVALLLSTMFVRLRDIGQVWELGLQLFFFGSAVIYPVGYLPPWARELVFLNPFTQVLQDIRAILLYPDLPGNRITAADAFPTFGHAIPIGLAFVTLVVGLLYFRRESPWFAERV